MSFRIYDDGYTRPGYIAAIDGLHDALIFEYRLLPVLERDKFRLALKRAPDQEARLTGAMLAKQVKSWNVVGENDKPIAITADSMLSLPSACFDKLQLIVFGVWAPDKQPSEATPDEAADYLAELEAAATGRIVGDVIAERDEKN